MASILRLALAGTLAFAFVAAVAAAVPSQPAPPTGLNCTGAQQVPSRLDYLLLTMRSQGDVAEIQMAQLALNRSSSIVVRPLAQMLLTDHTAAIDQKRQLALATGLSPVYEPSDAQKAWLQGLQILPAEVFDRAWLSTQVVLHLQAIDLANSQIRFGDDQRFIDNAQADLPVLQRHLYRAMQLLGGGD